MLILVSVGSAPQFKASFFSLSLTGRSVSDPWEKKKNLLAAAAWLIVTGPYGWWSSADA